MPIPRPDTDVTKQGGSIDIPPTRRARRRMFRRLEFCSVAGLAPICLDTNDPDTVLCGFAKRLMRPVPVPDPSSLDKLREFVAAWLNAHIPQARRLSFEEWLATTSYNEARKQELRVAHFALYGGRPTRQQCRKIKSFVKTESYPEYKHCRMINSRSDAFKVFSGPLFKAIEEVVYDRPEFIKHVPVPDRPSKVRELRRAGRRYYSTDFTAYESHFTRDVMQAVECQLYRHCLQWCPEDAECICETLSGQNCMSTHTGIRARMTARRMSGDMCTSLGNGFTNLMLAKFLAHEQGCELYGFVEGDDGLFATEALLTTEAYERLGFTIKIQEEPDPCSASFCGMVFADSGEIIRDPVDFCANFGWTSSFVGGGRDLMQQLLRAKALSSVYEMPQCPIVGAMSRYALAQTRGVVPRFVEDGYHHCPKDERPLPSFCPSADTRALMASKFGIDIPTQLYVESRVSQGDFSFGPLLRAHPHYAHYAARYVEVG